MKNYNCIAVLGPTASGKTHLACQLAFHLNGEIISADSRQVYRFLNIGTGKDLEEYEVNGRKIKYHLIDLVHPGEQFYLHQFIQQLQMAFDEITRYDQLPIICGGTGLYLDALRKDFSFTQIQENEKLRGELNNFSMEELLMRLKKFPADVIKHVDQDSKKRIIRGIEIGEYFSHHEPFTVTHTSRYNAYYIGIDNDIENRKRLISERLVKRLDRGLIEEVNQLLEMGISEDRLTRFGLEYKFVLCYLQNKITKDELFLKLQTAIFQFAKRQMTWFRKMEKEGVKINWVTSGSDIETIVKNFKLN